MNNIQIAKALIKRPIDATSMLWKHKRTLSYLLQQEKYRSAYNHIFTTYFIRGEDCGKGVLDPFMKLFGNAPFLWDIEMETTTACYLRCLHCEHTYWPDRSYLNQHQTLQMLINVLDSAPKLKWINLTGEGSSFLNPDFHNMIREVKNRGIYLDFSHDFVRLSDEDIHVLVNNAVDRVYWSFDGITPEVYDSIRIGAHLPEVIKNVQRLIKYKKEMNSPLPEICFRFAFMKKNVHQVSFIPTFLRKLVDNIRDYGDEPSLNIVALLEFNETEHMVTEIDPKDIILTNRDSKWYGITNYWSHITHIEEQKHPIDFCTFWSEPYVMVTGHVVPCCAVMMSNDRNELERMSFGNIKDTNLKEIWNTPNYKEFRKRVVNSKSPVPEICVGCRAFNTKTRIEKYGIWKVK